MARSVSADERAGLTNIDHLPYVRDNLVQLSQALDLDAHNNVVQTIVYEDFYDLFCLADFLDCVMLLAALHRGSQAAFIVLTVTISLSYLQKSLQAVLKRKFCYAGRRKL